MNKQNSFILRVCEIVFGYYANSECDRESFEEKKEKAKVAQKIFKIDSIDMDKITKVILDVCDKFEGSESDKIIRTYSVYVYFSYISTALQAGEKLDSKRLAKMKKNFLKCAKDTLESSIKKAESQERINICFDSYNNSIQFETNLNYALKILDGVLE